MHDGTNYVVVGGNGTILTSTDLAIWALRDSGITGNLFAVTFSGGRYFAVGGSGVIVTTTNLIGWAEQDSGTANNLFSITTDGANFIASGSTGTILDFSISNTDLLLRSAGTSPYPSFVKVQ
jgi:photosystem II stability/assembly factor-like uncharacterized protein